MATIALTRAAAISLLVLTVSSVSFATSGGASRVSSYTAIAQAVGRICGDPILRIPTVVFVRSGHFRALLAKLYGIKSGSLRRGGTALTAFYRPGKNVAVVNVGSGQAQQLARTVTDIRWFRRMEIFHEFVHAWQYQGIPRLRAALRDDPIVAQAVLEGQDLDCTRRYARANKVLSLFRREQRFVRNLRGAAGPRAMRIYFEFRRGYRFIRYLHIREPRLTVGEIFAAPMPSEKQIWFPDMYLDPEMDAAKQTRWVGKIVSSSLVARPRVTRIDFLGLRSYLVGSGCPTSFRTAILRAFIGGSRARCGERSLIALEFSAPLMAIECVRLAEFSDRLANGGKLSVGHFVMPGIHDDYFVVRSNKPQSARAVLMVRVGGLVWEAEQTGFMGRRPALRAWVRRLVDRYMKIDKLINRSKRK